MLSWCGFGLVVWYGMVWFAATQDKCLEPKAAEKNRINSRDLMKYMNGVICAEYCWYYFAVAADSISFKRLLIQNTMTQFQQEQQQSE